MILKQAVTPMANEFDPKEEIRRTPIAASGSQDAPTPADETEAPAEGISVAGGSNTFAELYEQTKQASMEQDVPVSPQPDTKAETDAFLADAANAQIPRLSRASGAKTAGPAAKKAKSGGMSDGTAKGLFIGGIILSAVLLLASIAYLAITRETEKAPVIREERTQASTPTTIIANLQSFVFADPVAYQQKYKGITFPEGIQEKYKSLYAQNQDYCGWLTVPNTCIDTPVYHQDNLDNYYLRHDNYMNYTKYGIPFLDGEAGVRELSRNSTIYGHNFNNRMIFGELEDYETLDFYKKSPVITYNTLYGDYKWKVFAAFRTNGDDTGDNGYLFYYVQANMSDSSFTSFYNQVMQRSYLKTTVDVKSTDKILTLSTCTYFFDVYGSSQNARFVVMARLVRPGESETVDTSGASVTRDVRYPQLYYDVFGGSNPYADSDRWYP